MTVKVDSADRRPRGLYPLPSGDVPSATRCVQLHIPDGDDYEKLLAGALQTLTIWSTYERDESHKATLVAQAWQNALFEQTLFDSCEANMFDVRIDPENECMLQKTEDGGETWEDVGSFYNCGRAAAADEIIEAIGDGRIGVPGQAGPDPNELGPQECRTFQVRLMANGGWVCPIPISAGYTIEIQNADGGWYDGAFLAPWHCPNGKTYALGVCGVDVPYQPTDPLQEGNHMQVVGVHGSTFFNPMAATPYVVPSGVENEALFLQANDASLGDNQGSVQFDVVICNAGFCYQWDFTAGDGGWTICDGYGEYVPGVGFRTTQYDGRYSLFMDKILPGGQTRVFYNTEITYNQTVNGGTDVMAWFTGQGSWVRHSDNIALAEGIHTVELVPYEVGVYDLMLNPNGYGTGPCTITRVKLWGYGTNPFGADNC